jgi:hypothetical protein
MQMTTEEVVVYHPTRSEIRVLQGFFTNTYNKPYPKGFSRCEKNLKVFLKPFTL